MYLAFDLASNPVARVFEAEHIFLRDAERREGFRGGLGACQYKYINNLTASSAFEGQTWQLHNGLRCSPSRTCLAFLSEQHREFIKTSHSCEVLILHQSLSLTVSAQAGAPK